MKGKERKEKWEGTMLENRVKEHNKTKINKRMHGIAILNSWLTCIHTY